jgi:hypothetical protein
MADGACKLSAALVAACRADPHGVYDEASDTCSCNDGYKGDVVNGVACTITPTQQRKDFCNSIKFTVFDPTGGSDKLGVCSCMSDLKLITNSEGKKVCGCGPGWYVEENASNEFDLSTFN